MDQRDVNMIPVIAYFAFCAWAIFYGAGKKGSLASRRVVGGLGCFLYAAMTVWFVVNVITDPPAL